MVRRAGMMRPILGTVRQAEDGGASQSAIGVYSTWPQYRLPLAARSGVSTPIY
jgi:hypothetical protein